MFPPHARELLSHLEHGRTLFGRKNASGWSYYAYLTAAEVSELHAGLARLQQSHPELKGETYLDGFVDARIGALATIARRKNARDLWMEAG